ncbi:MAG: endo alpha-1,4 polygalactosaminidase, partial [Proteobacteria bacterium]|nr:endo alpha-1,4 polygalactosaminidase [Pseudomonadota bacterium]
MPPLSSSRPVAFVVLALALCCFATLPARAAAPVSDATQQPAAPKPPAPKPIIRPVPQKSAPAFADSAANRAARIKRISAVASWGYQLHSLSLADAAASPFDLLVVDATKGIGSDGAFRREDVARLKSKPDGSKRLVVSYLSVGEAEDYRPDYFSPEYMSEDAPDWLGKENPAWKGNRLIAWCSPGWQATILGDEDGRSVYNSIEPSPLYRLIELGFDGIYLDRVDVYGEVEKQCPEGARGMVKFIARLAAHARKRAPGFLVILQNAEELVQHQVMLDTIDAIAKEDLFYGSDYSQKPNGTDTINEALGHLRKVKASGRPVFVVDYLLGSTAKVDFLRRVRQEGFVPYVGPRDLGQL